MTDPGQKARTERLAKARDRLRNLLEDPRRWNNECEEIFSEFRIAVVHLRGQKEALDAVEDKEVVWRFLCKLCRSRRPFWGRCEEVLHILKSSDAWVKALIEDPESNVTDLPTNIIQEFDSRCEEVAGRSQKYVRLAIVGCGPVAARHCAWMARHNERVRCDFFRVVALVDPAPERITALRGIPQANQLRLGSAEEVSTTEALFEQVDFDAAALLTHVSREEVLSALLAQGKLAIVEPPLAASSEAAVRMARLSLQPTGGLSHRILVAELTEYASELTSAKTHLASGTIGDIMGAEAKAACHGDEAADMVAVGIGCILVPGLRCIRSLRRLVGPVEEVIATSQGGSAPSRGSGNPFGSPRREIVGPETGSACILRHRGGTVSTLRLQTSCPRPQKGLPNVVINGTLGDLHVEESGARVKLESREPSRRPTSQADRRASDAGVEDISAGEHVWELFARLVVPIAHGADGAPSQSLSQAQPEELLNNIEEHLSDMAVAEALRLSSSSRRFEPVRKEALRASSIWDP